MGRRGRGKGRSEESKLRSRGPLKYRYSRLLCTQIPVVSIPATGIHLQAKLASPFLDYPDLGRRCLLSKMAREMHVLSHW